MKPAARTTDAPGIGTEAATARPPDPLVRIAPVNAPLVREAVACANAPQLPQLVPSPLPFRRTIRRAELRQIVPLADRTVYEMERRGEFPRRFYLTSHCGVWNLEEVEAPVEARRQASVMNGNGNKAWPDVRLRRARPVHRRP